MAPLYILRGIPLFKNLSNEELKHIAQRLHKEIYPKGVYVFDAGDLGDTMYLVESGQVAVINPRTRETITYMGPGSFVGEISLLLSEPRTASLKVVIDAELWAFRKKDFEELLKVRPDIGLEMMRELSQRLVTTTRRRSRLTNRWITTLVYPRATNQEKIDIGVRLARALHLSLKKPVGILPLYDVDLGDEAALAEGVMILDNDYLDEASLAKSLSYQVDVYKHIVLILPAEIDSLSQKAVDLADTVVSVGKPPRWLLFREEQKDDVWIIDTTQKDIQRVVRRLTNRTIGLALSSGGSRGVAHIGVIKVLLEEKIPIDLIAGTSAGAWFGAFMALGWDCQQFDEFIEEIKGFTKKFSNWDFNTPPRTGIVKGRKAKNNVIAPSVDYRNFEDLKIPLYMIAADILTGDEIVFDSGPLADAIRASLSVPVLADPWHYQDRYFVDGGIVNPLPASVLRDRGADIVIASSVIQPLKDSYGGSRDQMPSILQIVFNMFSAMEAEMVEKQLPLIDVLVQHRVSASHTLDFERVNTFVQKGEDAARKMLPAIKEVLEKPPDT